MWNFTGGGCAAGCSTMRELTRRMYSLEIERDAPAERQTGGISSGRQVDTKLRRIEAISKYLLSNLHRESVNRINDRRLV